MTGIIDHRSYNYSHGIISQDCLVKEFSDKGSAIKLVSTGTFVQVHSVRDDDVIFCIVRDDMEVEMNQMVCKRADIINVPENLWGPLFTVKKTARLSLVRDSKVAESIGNISVGNTVQVLGPDNSVICIANVTFRNSILRLGVGVYFGLQVVSPKENLQTIIEKVSLLGPGTKGFPRGCDIVVTVDKILPSNYNYSKEKSICYYDKECKKQAVKGFSSGDSVNSGTFKSVITYNIKDKQSKKDEGDDRADSLNHSRQNNTINWDISLQVGDKVVYLNGDIPEKGIVRWIGLRENSLKVEVEFERPIGSATGDDFGEFFTAKFQNSLFLPPTALIRYSDYVMNNSKEKFPIKKNNIINNNNNNNNNNINYSNNLNTNNLKSKISINNSVNNNNSNGGSSSSSSSSSSTSNNINNNDDCCRTYELSSDGKQDFEDAYKKTKKVSVSHLCLKHPEKSFDTSNCFSLENKEDIFGGKDLFKGGHKSGGGFEWRVQSISGNSEPGERCHRRSGNSVENNKQKETDLYLSRQTPKRGFQFNHSSHDLYDLGGPERERSHCGSYCSGRKVQKCQGGDDDFNFHEASAEKSSRSSYEKDDIIEEVVETKRYTVTCSEAMSAASTLIRCCEEHELHVNNVFILLKENSRKAYDSWYASKETK